MLRLFGFDSRGSGAKTIEESMPVSDPSSLHTPATPCDSLVSTASCSQSPPLLRKRRISHDDLLRSGPDTKRVKAQCQPSQSKDLVGGSGSSCTSSDVGEGCSDSSGSDNSDSSNSSKTINADFNKAPKSSSIPTPTTSCDMDRVRDVIQHQFGLEILHKHNELRLINQELAKCQIALEQLRRCHLIPYPVNCPTPEQMLNISDGKGFAVAHPDQPVPAWAPPFGVVDGPYSRHFAKWLIPDPVFDGMEPEAKSTPEPRVRGPISEGRTTRNSYLDPGSAVKGRHNRGPTTAQKHHALPNGYPTTKDKAGPCILKRASDGQMVKLACLDCLRENFSSTQGFINHCRIAHKRDFKSHEEAAIACGQALDPVIGGHAGYHEKPTTAPTAATCVHPFARHDMSEQEAYAALRSRIADSLELYKQGKLPGVESIPSLKEGATESDDGSQFEPSSETPYLSQLMKRRKFHGNLRQFVADAKIKAPMEDLAFGEDSEEPESPLPQPNGASESPVQRPVVMRVPARSVKLPVPKKFSAGRPASSKGRAAHPSIITPSNGKGPAIGKLKSNGGTLSDEDMDLEDAALSPNMFASNNAPSLVSDDGEYDSDEGSSVSGTSDNLEADSVSDVAEISLDDEHEPQALGRGSAMKLRKDDAKHVNFISPVRSTTDRRTRKL